jgi:citrate synthase
MGQGLEGIVAARTKLSHVDGELGELIIAGFPVAEFAARATFEEAVWLLWHGDLPDADALETFRSDLARRRELPPYTVDLLHACALQRIDVMDALRIAAGTILAGAPGPEGVRASPDQREQSLPLEIVARFPTIVTTYWHLFHGRPPISPRADLGHAGNYLFMLTGRLPRPEEIRGLETYLNTVIDHGLNASTFTARIITSTGSDLVSAIVGATGALKGPLHGGAPGPALDMVFEIGAAGNTEPVLRRKIESGERLMGFGHRVYKVRDPRADVLAAAAERMYTRGGDMKLYQLARDVEATAIRLLEEYKPGRRLQTNVEFYTALLLHGLGLDAKLFTPTFAISRVAGWIAHSLEQRAANRIIRPQSEYAGPRDRAWIPPGKRAAVAREERVHR